LTDIWGSPIGPLEDGPEQHMALFTAIPADVFGASGLENSFFFMVYNNGFGDLYNSYIYI
jgi:hypothetical protein